MDQQSSKRPGAGGTARGAKHGVMEPGNPIAEGAAGKGFHDYREEWLREIAAKLIATVRASGAPKLILVVAAKADGNCPVPWADWVYKWRRYGVTCAWNDARYLERIERWWLYEALKRGCVPLYAWEGSLTRYKPAEPPLEIWEALGVEI
jgi:hypothetical protein